VGVDHAVGDFLPVQARSVGDQADAQARLVSGRADLRIAAMNGAFATAAERHGPAAGLGEFPHELDALIRGNGVLEGEQVVEVLLVRRMEVAEIATHVTGAHDADAHMDGPERLAVDEFPQQVLVGQDLVGCVGLVESDLRQTVAVLGARGSVTFVGHLVSTLGRSVSVTAGKIASHRRALRQHYTLVREGLDSCWEQLLGALPADARGNGGIGQPLL
jgi:hypothetical protein